MKSSEFKSNFDRIAHSCDFLPAYDGWLKESKECIVFLNLQKSNFGNYFDLNIKIYIQGLFGKDYCKEKHLMNKSTGNVFRRQPIEYNDAFNLDLQLEKNKREVLLIKLFIEFINPFAEKALTRLGVNELAKEKQIYLLPAVKNELGL